MYEKISETVIAFDRWIDETHDWPVICGLEMSPATILRETDPIAYKCAWIDWADAEGIDTDELEDDYTFDRDKL